VTFADIFCDGAPIGLFRTGTGYRDAICSIFDRFNRQWLANAGSCGAGYVPEIQWQGVEKDTEPDPAKFWVRVSNATILEDQESLRGPLTTRYQTDGIVLCQLYCPKTEAGITIGRCLARVARDIFRGLRISASIKFINPRIIELDPEDKLYRFDVVIRYEYFEIV